MNASETLTPHKLDASANTVRVIDPLTVDMTEPQRSEHSADQSALRALHQSGGTLCTLLRVEGSYSRRAGAQLAILQNGDTAGDLADHCLTSELILQAQQLEPDESAVIRTYGKKSRYMDYRLPCGSTIDILIDPSPDLMSVRNCVAELDARTSSALRMPQIAHGALRKRCYLPSLRIIAFGEGPEAAALQRLASSYGARVEIHPAASSPSRLATIASDAWTAVLCLSHDHDWEEITLPWALKSNAFYVGAVGGARARQSRAEMLQNAGVPSEHAQRLRAPIGLFASARNPQALALSTLAEIAADYERLCDEQ